MKKSLPSMLVLALLAAPGVWAQKKNEMAELGRDLALLQEEVRTLKESQDQRLTGIEATLKTMLDQLNATSRAVAVLDSGLKDRMERSVVVPVSGVGAKVDGLQEDFRYVKENVAEVNARLGKLQQQVVDLGNVIKTMQAPPPPPGAQTMAPSASAPPPGVTAEGLFRDAMRDRSAGNLDLALKQFSDYVAWYGDTDAAAEATFYTGDIYYNQQVFDQALAAFDAVLERYPKGRKTLDAQYMKGRTLVKLGRRDEGADEFREIIRTSPSSPQAARSKSELRDLGLSAPASAPAKKKK
jgi:TolA-binding protein